MNADTGAVLIDIVATVIAAAANKVQHVRLPLALLNTGGVPLVPRPVPRTCREVAAALA